MAENGERILLGPLTRGPEQVQRRRRALGVSTAVQLALVAVLAWWPQPKVVAFRPQEDTIVRLDWPSISIPIRQRLPFPVLRPSARRPALVAQPQPRLVLHRLAAAEDPPLVQPRQLAEPGPMRRAAPSPVVSAVALPKFSTPDAGPDPVQLGRFAAAAVAEAKPADAAPQASGFGGPQTHMVTAAASNAVHAAGFTSAHRTGSDSAAGAGIRTGGFAAPAASDRGREATPSDALASAGFDLTHALTPTVVAAPAAPAYIPVEILYKPVPVYSTEGRQLGIQGDVVLAVLFQIDGQLRVARVVHGLGHGLDEAAEQAARQIRFRPAQRGGAPVETAALIRVTFQLTQ